jgi:hypothetical protein
MNYVFYEASGKIHSVLTCPESMFDIQTKPVGRLFIKTEVDVDVNGYVDGGVVYSLPQKPDDYMVFDYTSKKWVYTYEYALWRVRQERNERLQVTDWTQLSDIPAETKALWEPYRQALRDVTNQPDPFNIVWPTPPQ